MPKYERQFYDDLSDTALPSAGRILPMLLEVVDIKSAVDFGCGDGSWLSVLREHGVDEIKGIDGDWVDISQLKIPIDCFQRAAIERSIDLSRTFDLAISLEVAEHLPPIRAESFIKELCTAAPLVLFSAAIPHQGGVNHINEQWPAYWASIFAGCGYQCADIFRMRIWDDPDVTWWYKQNLLLFARAELTQSNSNLKQLVKDCAPAALVHPEKYEEIARRSRPSLGRWIKSAPAAFRNSLFKRFNKAE